MTNTDLASVTETQAPAHLPFPGLGHVRRDPDQYTWVPISYAPVVESSTELPRSDS
jgi:hypothetical protein